MKKRMVINIDSDLITKDEIDELQIADNVEFHIKSFDNNTPQEFIIPSIVVADLTGIAEDLITSAVYDGLKFLFKKVLDRSKVIMPSGEARRINITNEKGANIELIFNSDVTDVELANATRSAADFSKDNYIILVDKEQGIRIFTYLQYAQWKNEK